MATVTVFTAARMLAIENASVVDGEVVGDNLILTRHDATTIDAGDVRGPMGLPGDTPVGSIVDFIDTTPPTNWLGMIGQTITGGQTLYPDLWAIIPATMKSGVNIIMPDTRGRVSVGLSTIDATFDTIGETGGEKTHLLTAGESGITPHTHDPYGDDRSFIVQPLDGGNPDNIAFPLIDTYGGYYGKRRIYTGNVTGGAQPAFDGHNNLQPYIVFMKIIRALQMIGDPDEY